MAFDKYGYDQGYLRENIITKHVPFNKRKPEDMALLEWALAQGNFTKYIKGLILEDMQKRGAKKMVVNLAGTEINFDAAVELMDDEIREKLSEELAPCSEQEFFTAYEHAHAEKYGEPWELSKESPQY